MLASACLAAQPGVAASVDPGAEELPARIDDVRIHLISVLWKTKRSVILRELPWKPGDQVTREQWDLGVTRLWNTGLFSQISARIVHEGGRRIAVFDMEDRLTLNPLLKFALEGGGTGNQLLPIGGPAPVYWFHVGADDTNLFGTFMEAGFTYEMFGLNPGGRVWFHDPRLFDKRLDGWFEVNYLPRPRPGFTLFRGMARAQLSYEVTDEFVILGRADGILDRFINPPPNTGPTDKPHASEGAILSVSARIGRVDTIRLLQTGWSLEIQPAVGITDDPTHPTFTNGLLQFLGFIPVANRWNFALRMQTGVSSDAPPQDLLYIGGIGDSSLGGIWDHAVRGLEDNAITTNAFAMFNAEARVIAFDSTWIALMPAVFVDGVVAAGNPLGTNFNGPTQRAVSVGAGIRILIPRFVGTGLRLDGAYIVGEPMSQQGWYSIGVYQMF